MMNDDLKKSSELTRREFVKCFAGTTAYMSFASFSLPGPLFLLTKKQRWPIAHNVYTTAEQQIFPVPVSIDAPHIDPKDLALYSQNNFF